MVVDVSVAVKVLGAVAVIVFVSAFIVLRILVSVGVVIMAVGIPVSVGVVIMTVDVLVVL